jgi:hypothetical protein
VSRRWRPRLLIYGGVAASLAVGFGLAFKYADPVHGELHTSRLRRKRCPHTSSAGDESGHGADSGAIRVTIWTRSPSSVNWM